MNASKISSEPVELSEPTIKEKDSGRKNSMNEYDTEDFKGSDQESSVSGDSDDSEMEPFSEYLPKTEQLLNEIGLAGFSAEPLQYGYRFENCVYALKSPEDDEEQYVLRVPNCPEFGAGQMEGKCEAILNDASLLEFLAGKLPVPRVKAYCVTTENALKTPFTVQTKLPGQSLDKVYEDLNHSEKLAMIDQVVDLLAKVETMIFATAGTFAPSSPLPDIRRDFLPTAAPLIKVFDEGEEGFVKDPKALQDRAGSDVKALLTSHINGFIALEQANVEVHGTFRSERLLPLLQMLEDMDDEGLFKDGPYPIVLHHWDLEPRNIMVDQSNGTWRISGVIDWDDAVSVPRPMARRPPAWIWDIEPEMFTGYLNNDHDPTLNLSDENAALKAHFDAKAAAVLPGYLEDAYGRGRWLRRIWTHARNEIHDPYLLDRAEQLQKEWEARPRLIKPSPEMQRPTQPQPKQPKTIVFLPTLPKGLWKKPLRWLSQCVRPLRK